MYILYTVRSSSSKISPKSLNPNTNRPKILPKRMVSQQTNVTTAKSLEAGLIGLGKLGAKMTRMVLAMKLLQTLAASGIGTGEIENMAMKRKIQREIKCGNKDNLGNVK